MTSFPTRIYAGLVFVYFGEGEPPPFRTYPRPRPSRVIVADPPEVLPCTFWNKFDNDHGHIGRGCTAPRRCARTARTSSSSAMKA